MFKTQTRRNLSLSILINALCVLGLLILVFSATVFTQNERQRELLYRRLRSIITSQKLRHIRDFLPPLIQQGSEWRFQSSRLMGDCSQIPLGFEQEPIVGQGYNKQVYRYGQMAVKKPLLQKGRAYNECIKRSGSNEHQCLDVEIQGFISEIGLTLQLQDDPNVPKMFAYCIPVDVKKQISELALLVELGEPIDLIKYIDLSWQQRLHFVGEVLEFLERLQPFVFLDFRRQQFTFRNNQRPMYVDFDDVVLNRNSSTRDIETARKVYNMFANKYLWIGRPAKSVTVLNRIRRRFERNELGLSDFRNDIKELQNSKL